MIDLERPAPPPESEERTAMRVLGQRDLGLHAQALFNERLWGIQRHIASRLSRYRAQVTVPSCNSSGKTFLASRVVWAAFDAFKPGTPCDICGGPCLGIRIVTTSSTYEHLKDVLWGGIRGGWRKLQARGYTDIPKPYAGNNLLVMGQEDAWDMVGVNPETGEGIQGRHSGHKFIVAEEATVLDESEGGVASGLRSLLASGDARLLAIYNPTHVDTWVERMGRSPRVERIRIQAWDTPHFTGEPIPEGATLTDPAWIEDMISSGHGPGTYEWQTRVEAEPWGASETALIDPGWFDQACRAQLKAVGPKVLGVDLARYGNAENILAYRTGPVLTRMRPSRAMRQDVFWMTEAYDACAEHAPQMLVYDADGLGGGSDGDIERMCRRLERDNRPVPTVIGFRGAGSVGPAFTNVRSSFWWRMRGLYERGHIAIAPEAQSAQFREQSTALNFSFRGTAIRVETKEELRKRRPDIGSIDRADGSMYAFAYDAPHAPANKPAPDDRSDEAHWDRIKSKQNQADRERAWRRSNADLGVIDPITGVSDEW